MTRALTLLALGCLLLTGVAVASIFARGSIPTPTDSDAGQSSVEVSRGPVSNRQGKNDRLAVDAAAMASLQPSGTAIDGSLAPLRQAYGSDGSLGSAATVLPPIMVPQPNARPKAAAKPAQKTYTLLSDAQISAIKGRLNLTPSQESYWPGVETALRDVARKLHDSRQSNPGGAAPPIDFDSAEVQKLKSAAMPLLIQLREDQKREVRALARIIGLEKVAAAI